jgi:hypothetical protein
MMTCLNIVVEKSKLITLSRFHLYRLYYIHRQIMIIRIFGSLDYDEDHG